MLLVCNSAGSAFSYSCFCCSLSFLVSSLFLFFLYCSSISALMFVYHHCKILYILSLTGLYILLFLLPILNFLFFSVLFFFFNSVSIIFSLCFLLHFCFCLYYPQLFFHSSLYIVLNKESKRNNPPPHPKQVTSQLYQGLIFYFISMFPVAFIRANTLLLPSVIAFHSFPIFLPHNKS